MTDLDDVFRSEQRVRALFEQVAVGVAEIDTQTGCFITLNQKYADILGHSREALQGMECLPLTHPDDRAEGRARMNQMKRGEIREFAMEKRYRRQDGGYVWVTLTITPMWPEGAEPTRHVAVMSDISERKQAEARFVGVFEQAPNAVVVVDADGAIVLANNAASTLFGYTKEELLSLTVEALVPVEHRDSYKAVREEFFKTFEVRRLGRPDAPLHCLCKDGSRVPIETCLSPLQTREGQQVILVLRDLSEQVNHEIARAQLEAELRQAQKMEALGTLAGGVAHDFNNLLASIVGNLELAHLDLGPEHAATDHLLEIANAAHRATDLVRQILAFSRKQPMIPRVVSVKEITEKAVQMLRATVPAGLEIAMSCACEGSEAHALVDPTQLYQVLINLGTNAWHAMADRPGEITFECSTGPLPPDAGSSMADAANYARVRVVDRGMGMTAATIEHIFEPFFTTKEVGRGTGLGLAVVHGIVTDHGGFILVDSAPGAGSTFSVYLPSVSAAAAQTAKRHASIVRGNGHVLLVDDEHALVRVGERLLMSAGYTATVFTDPVEAVAAVKAAPNRFDLAVLDQNMPHQLGTDTARQLALIQPDLPVLLVSGDIAAVSDDDLKGTNIRGRLPKPFGRGELLRAISAVLTPPRISDWAESSLLA